jgi:hypothetical protein
MEDSRRDMLASACAAAAMTFAPALWSDIPNNRIMRWNAPLAYGDGQDDLLGRATLSAAPVCEMKMRQCAFALRQRSLVTRLACFL